MSPELKAFYANYQAWLDKGATWYKPYDRHAGLCENLDTFCDSLKFDEEKKNTLQVELSKQFTDAGLSAFYPFNKNGWQFDDLSDAGMHHENKKRNQWVKDHAT